MCHIAAESVGSEYENNIRPTTNNKEQMTDDNEYDDNNNNIRLPFSP